MDNKIAIDVVAQIKDSKAEVYEKKKLNRDLRYKEHVILEFSSLGLALHDLYGVLERFQDKIMGSQCQPCNHMNNCIELFLLLISAETAPLPTN